jgi:hypothetical protein
VAINGAVSGHVVLLSLSSVAVAVVAVVAVILHFVYNLPCL